MVSLVEDCKQNNDTPNEVELQANTEDSKTECNISPGLLFSVDEETRELAFEEYMMIMDSLCPKIEQSQVNKTENEEEEGGESKKLEIENDSFLEYLNKLCSDENFVRMVGTTLNIDYLESLLSSDPEPIDLLALEKGDQQVLKLVKQEQSHPPFDSFSHPVAKETSVVTPEVRGRAQSPVLDPAAITLDTNVKEDGQNAAQTTRNAASEKGGSSCSPLLPSRYLEETLATDATPEYYKPFSSLSDICPSGSLFMDHSFKSYLPSSPNISLNSHMEARDNDASAEKSLATVSSQDILEEPSFLSDRENIQSSQMIQSVQLLGGLPFVETFSTTRVWEQHWEPPVVSRKDIADTVKADLSDDSQATDPSELSALAQKKPHPLLQTSTPNKQGREAM
ncbi:hypothetical protein Q5P01_012124 [Channa striata]|uniref:Nuclear Testis protein N-terminal domain-containing protein n=1 Tax=Channa striata TaxID=64152 RepID=A0AA88MR44_CHASR|nr:hypothetical protein Q5P01_012124 [Channa striata]